VACVFRFELSTGLYMGWGGAFLAILGGGFLCSACKRMNPEGKKRYDPAQEPRLLSLKDNVTLTLWLLCCSGFYGAKAPRIYTATAKSDPDSGRAYV